MFTVVERLGEGEISLDGHNECHATRAETEEAPHNAYKAEHPNVFRVKAFGL